MFFTCFYCSKSYWLPTSRAKCEQACNEAALQKIYAYRDELARQLKNRASSQPSSATSTPTDSDRRRREEDEAAERRRREQQSSSEASMFDPSHPAHPLHPANYYSEPAPSIPVDTCRSSHSWSDSSSSSNYSSSDYSSSDSGSSSSSSCD